MGKQAKVTVEALEPHTTFGQAYEIGDTYEVEESLVDTLSVQGKAIAVDAAKATKSTAKRGAKKRTTAVEPMTLRRGAVARKARKSKK